MVYWHENITHVLLQTTVISFSFHFRNRIRQYPAFVNCVTIDLFTEWPNDALLEVAEKYLEGMVLGEGEDVSFTYIIY